MGAELARMLNSRPLPLDRAPISAFVICVNEEDQIAECLKSLAFCDEVLVIDSMSTDRTVAIADELGARVIQRAWTGYRDQKAFGLSHCSHEWVLNLDADERVSDELRENMLSVLRKEKTDEHAASNDGVAGYYVNRVVFFLGRWWRSGGWYPEYRLRFFRRSRVVWGGIEPHEKPLPQGATGMLAGEIYHFTYKNLDEQFMQLHRFSTIAAREEYRAGRRTGIVSLLLNPLVRMIKFFVFKRGYREGMAGLVVAITEGCYTFMKYAKLWEHDYNERARKNDRDKNNPGLSAGELEQVVGRFKETPVVVVGDIFLDHYVWGKVNRISPEAPVVVVNVTSEDRRLGGAGNVARNLASLGAKVSMCGIVGDDDDGRQLIGLLEHIGANTDGLMVDRTRQTICKSRVIAHSQQVVRIDHEIIKPLASNYAQGLATAIRARFADTKGIVVSDYGKGTICSEVFQPIQEGVKKGLLGSKKIPVLIDPKSPNFPLYSGASVIKPNRSEASEASGINIQDRATAAEAGRVLLQRWGSEMVLITLGEQGMVLVSSSDANAPVIEVDTQAQEVFDVSGAGDTVSAVFLLALAVGANSHQAAVLANYAAGVVVAEVGTVSVTKEELLECISKSGDS